MQICSKLIRCSNLLTMQMYLLLYFKLCHDCGMASCTRVPFTVGTMFSFEKPDAHHLYTVKQPWQSPCVRACVTIRVVSGCFGTLLCRKIVAIRNVLTLQCVTHENVLPGMQCCVEKLWVASILTHSTALLAQMCTHGALKSLTTCAISQI